MRGPTVLEAFGILSLGVTFGWIIHGWIREAAELHDTHRRGGAGEGIMITLRYRNGRGRVRQRSVRPEQLRRWLGRLKRRGLAATATYRREEIAWVYQGPAGWQYSIDDGSLAMACGLQR